jgi:dTDP-4-dehydrorhamnose reductase
MRIVVTGASGLLGAAVVLLARPDHEVLAASYRTGLRARGFEAVRADLLEGDAFAAAVRAFRPDWVCHGAALTNVDLCERSPELARRMNVDASRVVAEVAASTGARLLLVSTDSVFDGRTGWYGETDAPHPLNAYAASKADAERAVAATDPQALIVRTNFYGWNLQPKQSLAEWILAELRAGARIPGWEDVAFTPLFAGDLAALLLRMMDARLEGTYHAAGADRCSKYAFGRSIAEVWGLDPRQMVPTRIGRMLATRPRDTSLRSAKLEAALGCRMPALQAGLEQMRAWETTHLAGLRALAE